MGISGERIAVAVLAILVLVAGSSTSLVVAETRKVLVDLHHQSAGQALPAVPANGDPVMTYQLCPDGSTPSSDGSCPVHHTRVS